MAQAEMQRCPLCGYPGLDRPAYDEYGCSSFDICACCGVQFGYDDSRTPHLELRRRWLARGAPWHYARDPPPAGWSPIEQLKEAGLPVPPEVEP
jgi:hypothetical protein